MGSPYICILGDSMLSWTTLLLIARAPKCHGLPYYWISRGIQVSWATILLFPRAPNCCGLPYLCSRVTYDQTMPGSEALPILYAIGIVPSICHQNMTHKEVVLMPYAIRLFPVQRPCPYYVPSESVTLRGFGHAILYQSIPGVEILPMPCALGIASLKGIAHAMGTRLSLVKKPCLCLSQTIPSLKPYLKQLHR